MKRIDVTHMSIKAIYAVQNKQLIPFSKLIKGHIFSYIAVLSALIVNLDST